MFFQEKKLVAEIKKTAKTGNEASFFPINYLTFANLTISLYIIISWLNYFDLSELVMMDFELTFDYINVIILQQFCPLMLSRYTSDR